MCNLYNIAAVVASTNVETGAIGLWFGIVEGPNGGYYFLDRDSLLKLYERETGRRDVLKYASEHYILALSAKRSIIMAPVDAVSALQVYKEHYQPSRNLRCHKLLIDLANSKRPFTYKACILRARSDTLLSPMYGNCLVS